MNWQEQVVLDLVLALESRRNPVRAVQVEAYMKNHFTFFGMEATVRRGLQKPWVQSLKSLENRENRWELIHLLWEKEEREFQYAAIDWLNSWPKKWMDPSDGKHLRHLISSKSWWDSVDAIASNYLGKWAKQFPKESRNTFEQWRHAETFWLQRSCLIYQLKYKNEVDVAYLESLIVQLLPEKEFFIQKAIGWSLRELSKHRPEAVEHILEKHPVKALALREAKKYL